MGNYQKVQERQVTTMQNVQAITHSYFNGYDSLNFGHRSQKEWGNLTAIELHKDEQLYPLDHPLRNEAKAEEWIKRYYSWGCKIGSNDPNFLMIKRQLAVLKKKFPHLPKMNLYVCNDCGVLQHIPVNTSTTCWACNQVCVRRPNGRSYPHWTSITTLLSKDKFKCEKSKGGCVLCLGEMCEGEKVVRFPADGCCHHFHSKCLGEYMNFKENLKCPICTKAPKLSRQGYIGTKNWTDEDLMQTDDATNPIPTFGVFDIINDDESVMG